MAVTGGSSATIEHVEAVPRLCNPRETAEPARNWLRRVSQRTQWPVPSGLEVFRRFSAASVFHPPQKPELSAESRHEGGRRSRDKSLSLTEAHKIDLNALSPSTNASK
jgi:hypothetical protein